MPFRLPAVGEPANASLHGTDADQAPRFSSLAANTSARYVDSLHSQSWVPSMASVLHPSANRWVVHLASRSDPDSEVTVELAMSKTTADDLAYAEAARIAAFNPDTPCSTTDIDSAANTGLPRC